MLRFGVVAMLLASFTLTGCSWFATKKQPLPGERISVLSLDTQLIFLERARSQLARPGRRTRALPAMAEGWVEDHAG